MGTHFTVTVDHDIRDTSLDAVRGRFTPLLPILEEISKKAERESDRWRDVSEPGSARPYLFYIPGGFTLQIETAALKLHHITRFSAFIEDKSWRDLLRKFCYKLSRLLGRDRVLYAPCEGIGDEIADWLSVGLSLGEIEARLRQRSSPAASIDDLARRSPQELRYFIDKFEDCYVDAAG